MCGLGPTCAQSDITGRSCQPFWMMNLDSDSDDWLWRPRTESKSFMFSASPLAKHSIGDADEDICSIQTSLMNNTKDRDTIQWAATSLWFYSAGKGKRKEKKTVYSTVCMYEVRNGGGVWFGAKCVVWRTYNTYHMQCMVFLNARPVVIYIRFPGARAGSQSSGLAGT